jgi:hypothetical protein
MTTASATNKSVTQGIVTDDELPLEDVVVVAVVAVVVFAEVLGLVVAALFVVAAADVVVLVAAAEVALVAAVAVEPPPVVATLVPALVADVAVVVVPLELVLLAQAVMLVPAVATMPIARARPRKSALLNETSDPARMLPKNDDEVPIVALVPSCQKTLQGDAPPIMAIEDVAVERALPIWKTHTPSAGPSSVSVPEVRSAVVAKQYTPGESVIPPSCCPVKMLAAGHARAASVLYVLLAMVKASGKAAKAAASPWSIEPTIEHEAVCETVVFEPTSPCTEDDVQVTPVPPSAVKLAASPREGI